MNGPKLYNFRISADTRLRSGPYYRPGEKHDGEYWREPPDAPPFLVGPGHLPEALRIEIHENGFSIDTWNRILESEHRTLTWRGKAKHLDGEWPGGELVSCTVFDALRLIAPGSFYSRGEFTIYGGRASSYHLLGLRPFPLHDNEPEECDQRPTVLGMQSTPPFEGAYPESIDSLAGQSDAVLAFPTWMARGDKVLQFGRVPVVTEQFVEQWRNTEISRHLCDPNNFEHDIVFTPGSGCGRIPYRWIDGDQ